MGFSEVMCKPLMKDSHLCYHLFPHHSHQQIRLVFFTTPHFFGIPYTPGDLDWFDRIRHKANQALQVLEETSDSDWDALDTTTLIHCLGKLNRR